MSTASRRNRQQYREYRVNCVFLVSIRFLSLAKFSAFSASVYETVRVHSLHSLCFRDTFLFPLAHSLSRQTRRMATGQWNGFSVSFHQIENTAQCELVIRLSSTSIFFPLKLSSHFSPFAVRFLLAASWMHAYEPNQSFHTRFLTH